jgi:uncharacterized lipoprotein YajG
MKTQHRFLALVAAVALLPGCAFTPAQLEVKPHAATRVAGPLKDIGLVEFRATQLEDARQDKARIGYKKNGFGQNTADITTSEPVDQIVEKTIDKAIVDSGHTVGDDGVLQIVGTVDRFWFDVDVNFWTVTFVGEVACTLDFIDAQTKQSVHKSKYAGSYSVDKVGGLEKTWTEVMAMALDKLIEDITLDEDMADALKAHVAAKGSTPPP